MSATSAKGADGSPQPPPGAQHLQKSVEDSRVDPTADSRSEDSEASISGGSQGSIEVHEDTSPKTAGTETKGVVADESPDIALLNVLQIQTQDQTSHQIQPAHKAGSEPSNPSALSRSESRPEAVPALKEPTEQDVLPTVLRSSVPQGPGCEGVLQQPETQNKANTLSLDTFQPAATTNKAVTQILQKKDTTDAPAKNGTELDLTDTEGSSRSKSRGNASENKIPRPTTDDKANTKFRTTENVRSNTRTATAVLDRHKLPHTSKPNSPNSSGAMQRDGESTVTGQPQAIPKPRLQASPLGGSTEPQPSFREPSTFRASAQRQGFLYSELLARPGDDQSPKVIKDDSSSPTEPRSLSKNAQPQDAHPGNAFKGVDHILPTPGGPRIASTDRASPNRRLEDRRSKAKDPNYIDQGRMDDANYRMAVSQTRANLCAILGVILALITTCVMAVASYKTYNLLQHNAAVTDWAATKDMQAHCISLKQANEDLFNSSEACKTAMQPHFLVLPPVPIREPPSTSTTTTRTTTAPALTKTGQSNPKINPAAYDSKISSANPWIDESYFYLVTIFIISGVLMARAPR